MNNLFEDFSDEELIVVRKFLFTILAFSEGVMLDRHKDHPDLDNS